MKKHVLIFSLTMAAFTSQAQKRGETPYQTKSLSGDNISSVKAETTGGNISMQGVNAGDAKIEVFIWSDNGRHELSKEEVQKRLAEDYDLNISVEDHKLIAIAKPKHDFRNWNNHGLSISFRIYVPKNASGHLRTSGGNINLDDLSGGSQDFTTSGGNLDIDHVTGKIKGRTSGGNVTVKNSSDNIDLTTSGGNVDAEKCNGEITLSTSGGNVDLEALNGNIEATTSGGSIHGNNIDGSLNTGTSGGSVTLNGMSGTLEASTSGGNLDVTMHKLGKYVKLHNSGGNVDLEVPNGVGMNLKLRADKIKVSPMNNFSGDTDEHHIEGTLNGGGVPVTIDGGSGRIHLTLK